MGFELTEISNFEWHIIQGTGTIKGNLTQTIVLETKDEIGILILTAATNTITGTATITVIHGIVNRIFIECSPSPFEIEVARHGTLTAHAYNRF
jgi:hypothetical protein